MILSVSRRTDVPNYYSDWFLNRIKEGFLYVRNPMNMYQISRIDLSPDVIDCIVFWTKNPANMIEKLGQLQDYAYYFQFTLTGYGKDVEPNLPNKRGELIPTFQRLSERIGKEKVIWRYDPVFLSERYTIAYHLKAFQEIAERLTGYTEKVVISFLDQYQKIQQNMQRLAVRQMTDEEMCYLAGEMAQIASKHHFTIEACAEKTDFREAGIWNGSCIDKRLIEKIIGCRLVGEKDKNQRKECRCLESVEVGAYNTCLNGCKYCYANFNSEKVKENAALYHQTSPLLCGNITSNDKFTVRKMKSLKDRQLCFLEQ